MNNIFMFENYYPRETSQGFKVFEFIHSKKFQKKSEINKKEGRYRNALLLNLWAQIRFQVYPPG